MTGQGSGADMGALSDIAIPDVGLLGETDAPIRLTFTSLHNAVYIIFVHKLQKRFFFFLFLDNPGNLHYYLIAVGLRQPSHKPPASLIG